MCMAAARTAAQLHSSGLVTIAIATLSILDKCIAPYIGANTLIATRGAEFLLDGRKFRF
jgi:hypothetical protein